MAVVGDTWDGWIRDLEESKESLEFNQGQPHHRTFQDFLWRIKRRARTHGEWSGDTFRRGGRSPQLRSTDSLAKCHRFFLLV